MNLIPEDKRGIFKPTHCCRARDNCDPLAQISSSDGTSFVCLGHNDGSKRTVEQDRMTFCFRNGEDDAEWDVDEHDVLSMIGVLGHGIAVDNCMKEVAKCSK